MVLPPTTRRAGRMNPAVRFTELLKVGQTSREVKKPVIESYLEEQNHA